MDENGDFILNPDCILEIMKYIITDTSKNNDLISFVLAHELFLELFATHHKRLYESLEKDIVRRTTELLIDLRVNKLSNRNRHLFWRSHLHSIKGRTSFHVDLSFALYNNNEMVCHSNGEIRGLFSKTKAINLNVNLTPEALVDICRSLPNLRTLSCGSTEVSGRISDMLLYCKNLRKLSIVLRTGSNVAQLASLSQLPNLKTFIITGIYKSGWQSMFFDNLERWKRPTSLRLTIEGVVSDKSITGLERLRYLQTTYSNIVLSAVYVLNKSPEDYCSILEYPGTKYDSRRKVLVLKINEWSDLSQIKTDLSKLPEIISLVIKNESHKGMNHLLIEKLLESIAPTGCLALKSFKIYDPFIIRSHFTELAKIKSIHILKCCLSRCQSIEYLNQFCKVKYLEINVSDSLDSNTSLFVLNLLSTCQVKAKIICKNVHITLMKDEKNLHIFMKLGCTADSMSPLAQLSGVNTLQISGLPDPKSLNRFFEAFATSRISSIEELDISKLDNISFNSISKVANIQSIRKLACHLIDLTGIEQLANLNKLQELTIKTNEFGTLSSLFTSLAAKNVIQHIKIPNGRLSPQEVLQVSQIRSLKKLECSFADLQDQRSMSELANSRIEELVFFYICFTRNQTLSLMTLLRAFSSKRVIALQRLEIIGKALDISEVTEISKLTVSKSLQIACFDSLWALACNPLCNLQKLELNFHIGFRECKCLVELETLESLKCSIRVEKGTEILANIKSLKELIIVEAQGSLSEFYRPFAHTNLQKLHTPIISSDEIHEISQVKSLADLNIDIKGECDNLSEIGQLTELKTLRMTEKNLFEIGTLLSCKDNVLPIFRKCKKLDHVTLEFGKGFMKVDHISEEIYKIIRSIRDPVLRSPLKLCIQSYNHVEDIHDEPLKVSSIQIHKHRYFYRIVTNFWLRYPSEEYY